MLDPVTNHKAIAKHSKGAIDAEPNHSAHTTRTTMGDSRQCLLTAPRCCAGGRHDVNTSMWLAATQLSAADVDVDTKDVLAQATSLFASILHMHYKLFKITANLYLL